MSTTNNRTDIPALRRLQTEYLEELGDLSMSGFDCQCKREREKFLHEALQKLSVYIAEKRREEKKITQGGLTHPKHFGTFDLTVNKKEK